MTLAKAVERWNELWEEGQCVGIMGKELCGLPCAQTVCEDPVHLGMGAFRSRKGTHEIKFNGGGATESVRNSDGSWRFSWTPIVGTPEALAAFGLSAEEQRRTFEDWLEDNDEGIQ